MEDWVSALRGKQPEAAWDLFLGRYRRLIFAAIRHYAQDYDDVMDVFARVCEALREDDFRRLRAYAEQPTHRARFSTWLVTVVRHLTIDWFRHRDGHRRLFWSDRPGGPGGGDIWTSTRRSVHEAWTPPENLGTAVNSPSLDFQPSLSFDARTLVFASNRPGSIGGSLDIWMTTRTPSGR